MKTLITTFALLCSIAAQGQTTRKGNIFVQAKRETVRDTLVTSYKYESNGKVYPIVVNRKTGTCYIWKVSKNGKGYRQYMNKEIKETINKELNLKTKKS